MKKWKKVLYRFLDEYKNYLVETIISRRDNMSTYLTDHLMDNFFIDSFPSNEESASHQCRHSLRSAACAAAALEHRALVLPARKHPARTAGNSRCCLVVETSQASVYPPGALGAGGC